SVRATVLLGNELASGRMRFADGVALSGSAVGVSLLFDWEEVEVSQARQEATRLGDKERCRSVGRPGAYWRVGLASVVLAMSLRGLGRKATSTGSCLGWLDVSAVRKLSVMIGGGVARLGCQGKSRVVFCRRPTSGVNMHVRSTE